MNIYLAQLCNQIKLTPTDHQISSITMLKKIYKSEEDILNRLLYHLRPKNTVMKAVYSSVKFV
jgi:hypothetical protein